MLMMQWKAKYFQVLSVAAALLLDLDLDVPGAFTLWHASISDKALSELIQMSMVNLLLGILQPWELKHLVKVSPFSVASQPEGG